MKRLRMVVGVVALLALQSLSVLGAAPARAVDGAHVFIHPAGAGTPNPSTLGQTVTLRASVGCDQITCSPRPHGTVDFYDGSTKIATATLEAFAGIENSWFSDAAADVTFNTIGDHLITIKYVPGDYVVTGDASYTQKVEKFTTNTSIGQSPSNTVFGQPVTLSATVTSPDPLPAGHSVVGGQLQFYVDGSAHGARVVLTSDTATLVTSTLPPGSHNISASFFENDEFKGSNAPTIQHSVAQGTSTTALSSSLNPSVAGQNVVFTATVTPVPPAAGTPTGTVTFKDNDGFLGTGTLSGGQATYATSTLAAGHHMITATYDGTDGYSGSPSSPVDQVVDKKASTATVTSGTNPSFVGDSVSFTASVTGAGGTPTGTVTLVVDGIIRTYTTLSNGQAVLTVSDLVKGNHEVYVLYEGDGTFLETTSPAITQVVNKRPSSTLLASSANPSTFGQGIVFTATVSGAGATPTGTVTFTDGATVLGTATLTNGVATYSPATLAPGTHAITATYSGDGAHDPSSKTLSQSVTCTGVSTNVPGNYVVASGQSVCFNGVTIGGSLMVQAGGAVVLNNTTVRGLLSSTGAKAISACASRVGGSVTIDGTTSGVTLGGPGCAANTFSGSMSITNNLGGTTISGNTVGGVLKCTGNNPVATNGGSRNSVAAARYGECASPTF